MKYNIGDKVRILLRLTGHQFNKGEVVTIVDVNTKKSYYRAVNSHNNSWCVEDSEIELYKSATTKITMTQQQIADYKQQLLKAQVDLSLSINNTITTLEIKKALQLGNKDFHWTQAEVSTAMDDLAKTGQYTYTSTGAYRIYSAVTQPVRPIPVPVAPVKKTRSAATVSSAVGKSVRISRKDALAKMQNNKGQFFTATWDTKNTVDRVMNCRYKGHDATLGYVQVIETKSKIQKQINLQTLKALRIGGVDYKVK